MATVFETRLIGNIGKDAIAKKMDKGVIAINFPVAHNKNWKDKKSGQSKTKTTWVNCTIWKRDGANLRILDYLKKGTLVELIGTPYAKAFTRDNGEIRAEIRLNISKTNILKLKPSDSFDEDNEYDDDNFDNTSDDNDDYYNKLDNYTMDEDDF